MKYDKNFKKSITKIINDVDPITQENISSISSDKLIVLQIDGNEYGFDVDSLNNYISKSRGAPKNPFTNEIFSHSILKEIETFNKKRGNKIP